MKKTLLLFSLMGTAFLSQAQVKVSESSGTPNPDAYLQLGEPSGSKKGLLLSRIALVNTTSFAPLAAHTAGMIVYNTATAGDVTPGYYFNDGTKWVRVVTATGGSGATPWYSTKTNSSATANTDSVYVMGKVGVGTATPAAKLDVNGDALINGITAGRGSGQKANNSVFGNGALAANTTGEWNVGVGELALADNTIGIMNAALGASALQYNENGSQNTALGYYSLRSNASSMNTAVGYSAAHKNITGGNNTAIGSSALQSKVHGDQNTALGSLAGVNQTQGDNNIMIGFQTDVPNLTGSNQMNIGNVIYGTGMTGSGAGNIGIGTSSPAAKLEVAGGDARINGVDVGAGNGGLFTNAALGGGALSKTTGGSNVAVGYHALNANTSGYYNIAVGGEASKSNTTGVNLIAIGDNALASNKTGDDMIAIGRDALKNTVDGGNANIAIGRLTLSDYTGTTGSSGVNTVIGYNTGRGIVSGQANTIIGANVSGLPAGLSNTVIIADGGGNQRIFVNSSGNVGIGNGNPAYRLDVAGDINARGSVRANGVVLSSDVRYKQNISTINNALGLVNQMRGTTYNFRTGEFPQKEFDNKQHSGFIAQELEKVLPWAVTTGSDGYKFVNYTEVIPVLTNAIKEQQTQIESLQTKVDKQQAQIDALTKAVQQLQAGK